MCKNLAVIQRSEGGKDQEHPQQEAKVADPVHDKSLFRGIVVIVVFKPEADQKVGTESDPLPPDEHDGIVGTHDQHQHEEHEKVHVGKEPVEAGIFIHITH